jgi:hypothetical protein
MKRIVVGDFESMKKIEKLLIRDEQDFGIYSDFEAFVQLDIDRIGVEEIMIYLEDLQTFNKHHDLIRRYQDRIVLLLAKREIRRQREFLENEGYKTAINLKTPSAYNEEKPKKNQIYSPQVIIFTGKFNIAFKTAYVLSKVSKLKCVFSDLDTLNGFSQLRLRRELDQEWVYLNEQMTATSQGMTTHMGNLSIAPIIPGSNLNSVDLESWIGDCRKAYDIHFIYCPMMEMKLVQRLLPSTNRIIAVSDLSYENLVAVDRWMKTCEGQRKGCILGIDYSKKRMNYLVVNQWIESEILGILKSNEIDSGDNSRKLMNIDNMGKKERNTYLKILRTLDIIRG